MNNEEIAKHTGVPIERVNQIEAEEFDRISKAVAPCPVFVEAADHERIKVERDGIAKQLADLVRYASNLDDDNDSLREQLEKATLYSITCVHHTDAERAAITCPVCLATQLASAKEKADAYTQLFNLNPSAAWAQIASLREQLAIVTKERDELAKDPMEYARIFWRNELVAANERVEKLESELELSDTSLRDICLIISDGKFDPSDGEGTSPDEIASMVKSERDSLLLQLQQEKDRHESIQRKYALCANGALVMDKRLLQCQAACAKKDEALMPFANLFAMPCLNVGGGTRLSATIELQAFKDAFAALSTPPAAALAEALESAFRDGMVAASPQGDYMAEAWMSAEWLASDTRKKLP